MHSTLTQICMFTFTRSFPEQVSVAANIFTVFFCRHPVFFSELRRSHLRAIVFFY
jgi:hypothetical protein